MVYKSCKKTEGKITIFTTYYLCTVANNFNIDIFPHKASYLVSNDVHALTKLCWNRSIIPKYLQTIVWRRTVLFVLFFRVGFIFASVQISALFVGIYTMSKNDVFHGASNPYVWDFNCKFLAKFTNVCVFVCQTCTWGCGNYRIFEHLFELS